VQRAGSRSVDGVNEESQCDSHPDDRSLHVSLEVRLQDQLEESSVNIVAERPVLFSKTRGRLQGRLNAGIAADTNVRESPSRPGLTAASSLVSLEPRRFLFLFSPPAILYSLVTVFLHQHLQATSLLNCYLYGNCFLRQ
jgi:hypothetical protein